MSEPYTPPKSKHLAKEKVSNEITSHQKVYAFFAVIIGSFYVVSGALGLISYFFEERLFEDWETLDNIASALFFIAGVNLTLGGLCIILKGWTFSASMRMTIIGYLLTIWCIPLSVWGIVILIINRKNLRKSA